MQAYPGSVSETRKAVIWTTCCAIVGGIAGALLGSVFSLPGAGPIGIGLAIGAVVGYLIGVPKRD